MKNIKNNLFKAKYSVFRPQNFKSYDALKFSQFWSADQLAEWHREKKAAIVNFAFENIPLYKKLYSDEGFRSGDIQQPGFFDKLPVLTKDHIRNYFNELIYPPFIKHSSTTTTGGSTGVPTKIMYDKRYPFEALGWRMMEWWGISPSDDGAYVWRNRRPKGYKQLLNEVLWWPTRKIRLDASCTSEQELALFIANFNKVSPPLLQGYVGAIAELAEFIQRTKTLVHKPRAVWLTSAPITDVQRYLVENVFNAPVYDQYGCCEVPHIAAQCRQRGGLHVNAESVLVDVVDNTNRMVEKGVWGKLLLTKLDERLFPLIRYEVGDNGRYLNGDCPCGVTLPLLDKIKGRISDTLKLPSGRILSGEYLTTIFDSFPEAINAFCVIQKKNSIIEINVVPSHVYSDSIGEIVRAALKDKVNGEVEIDFKLVKSIEHDRGKIRFVVRES